MVYINTWITFFKKLYSSTYATFSDWKSNKHPNDYPIDIHKLLITNPNRFSIQKCNTNTTAFVSLFHLFMLVVFTFEVRLNTNSRCSYSSMVVPTAQNNACTRGHGIAALKCCLDETESMSDGELWGILNTVFTMEVSSTCFIDKVLCHFLHWFSRHIDHEVIGFWLLFV